MPYQPSLYRRFVTWMRVVLPPGWTIAIFLLLYFIAEFAYLVLSRYATQENWTDQRGALAPLIARFAVVAMAVISYAAFRVLGFNPLTRSEYRRWLQRTPWQHPKRLPFGPVHLLPQDGVLIGVAVLLCHGSPGAQCVIPLVFSGMYLGLLGVMAYFCELRTWAYSITFSLGLLLLVSRWWPIAGLVLAAALLVVGYPVLSAILNRFPWSDSIVKSLLPAPDPQSNRSGIPFDRTKLGWPIDLLQRTAEVFPTDWARLIIESLLIGWIFGSIVTAMPSPEPEKVVEFEIYGYSLLTAMSWVAGFAKLMGFCWHCRPPISLWGRIVTGRWLIPRYDGIIIGPFCAVVAGTLLPILLRRAMVPFAIGFSITIAVVIFLFRAIGPSWSQWLLTGNHRLVPGITKSRDFTEI